LLSFWILFFTNAPLFALKSPEVYHVQKSSNQYAFDLDFGSFEIKQAQAYFADQWQSVRLPASVGKNKQPKPEIDFIGDALEKTILSSLAGQPSPLVGEGPQSGGLGPAERRRREGRVRGSFPNIFLASLEPVSARKGIRLAYGEIWLDKELAIKVTLMESAWSSDPRHWWIAYPAQYNSRTKRWDDLFVARDKEFKKKVLDLVRDAYLERYEK